MSHLVCIAKLLACQSHSGGVDDGHELLDVLGEELVEEALVSVQEVDHVEVLVQGLLVPAEIPEAVVDLLQVVERS